MKDKVAEYRVHGMASFRSGFMAGAHNVTFFFSGTLQYMHTANATASPPDALALPDGSYVEAELNGCILTFYRIV